ncbi:MAG: hypothetical protein ABFD97_09450 [Syntrophobacter sp.]
MLNREMFLKKFRESEWKWFIGSGVVVGVLFNVALQARPYDLGGLAGGILSAVLIYLMA